MIRVTHIDKYYNRGKGSEVHALRDVNLTIQQGERIGIIGTSGSGKSTLLKVLGLLEVPDNGDYWLNDENVVRSKEKEKANLRSRQIGFVMQDFALMEDRSVLENVMTPLLFDRRYTWRKAKEKAYETLHRLSLEDLAKRKVSQLPGARSNGSPSAGIVNDPLLLLADEPTGALDSRTAAEVLHVLLELNQQGQTLLIVTHDSQVAASCRTIYRMEDGHLQKES
ncbi:MAG: ABC transporter ATP-binding protein [Merdibacter sp.]